MAVVSENEYERIMATCVHSVEDHSADAHIPMPEVLPPKLDMFSCVTPVQRNFIEAHSMYKPLMKVLKDARLITKPVSLAKYIDAVKNDFVFEILQARTIRGDKVGILQLRVQFNENLRYGVFLLAQMNTLQPVTQTFAYPRMALPIEIYPCSLIPFFTVCTCTRESVTTPHQ